MRPDVQAISMAMYTKYGADETKTKIPKARSRRAPTVRTSKYSREASRHYKRKLEFGVGFRKLVAYFELHITRPLYNLKELQAQVNFSAAKMIDFGAPCGGAETANVVDHTPLTACDDLSGRISMAADDALPERVFNYVNVFLPSDVDTYGSLEVNRFLLGNGGLQRIDLSFLRAAKERWMRSSVVVMARQQKLSRKRGA